MEKYDLAVIGSGPAGHFGAIQAAKLGKRVVVIEQHDRVGGVSALSGTLPSKALREAALHLTGLWQRAFLGGDYLMPTNVTVQDLTASTAQVVRNETAVFESQLRRNGVQLLHGQGRFVGPTQIEVDTPRGVATVAAEVILIATGSRPAQPPGITFDGRKIIDSKQILSLPSLPKRLIVVGAGVIGIEYACIYSALGCEVALVDSRPDILDFVDRQIVETLKVHMRNRDVEFYLGEEVTSLEVRGAQAVAVTRSNKELMADCILYSVGRQANTDGLNLESTGINADARGRIAVDEHFHTGVGRIYAAGDVIGFPALAATSREQGRLAVCHAFGVTADAVTAKVPLGIYAIPEISMVGPTEEQLTREAVPYEIGVARYREIARGQILGDTEGLLKLVFDRNTLKILAVHIIGEGATELIHIGQAAEALGGTLQYFVNAVFNYPTLAECYKVAALDGMNRVGAAQAAGQPG